MSHVRCEFCRREAPTSIVAKLDATKVHLENPRELLHVPHILRKLNVRGYEASDSELNLRAFLRCKSRCNIASDWFINQRKKKSSCASDTSWRRLLVALSCGGAGDGASRPV